MICMGSSSHSTSLRYDLMTRSQESSPLSIPQFQNVYSVCFKRSGNVKYQNIENTS